jgi:GH18 family chitinase
MGMKIAVRAVAALLLSAVTLALPFTGNAGEKITKPWVTGYLPGYEQAGNGSVAFMDADDWKMVTHVVHFSAHINADGSLDYTSEQIDATKRAAALSLAHQNNVPILFSVNSWQDTYNPILADASKRQTLITALITVLNEGYDGLDLDLEPITPYGSEVNANYEVFVTELHARMKQEYNAVGKKTPLLARPLLAVAAGPDGRDAKLLARLQDKIDQINIMSYNQATVWEEVTWHDSALYDGGKVYPSTGGKVSSVDAFLKKYIAAGIPASKLGLGISLEIRIWQGGTVTASTNGVTAPMQTWTAVPKDWTSGTPLESVAQLMQNRYQPQYYHWDKDARVPYLSIDNTGSANDLFISYNDPRSVTEKVNYIKQNGLGGLMLWHLRLDYQPEKPAGERRPIMKAVRKALHTGTGKYKPLPVP